MRSVQLTTYGPPSVVHIVETEQPHAGPGQVRISVNASGISTGEVRLRSGGLRGVVAVSFPFRTGLDVAGVVDEVGDGVVGVEVGDEVFGMVDSTLRGANADFAVLVAWAHRPPSWTWEEAGGAAGSVETATRVLDRMRVGEGATVLVQGAAGATGTVIVQFARARGATVIGTASQANHPLLRSLGATPTTYGPGLIDRIHALAPNGVDTVIDCAGGALSDLIAITGNPARVVTIADTDAAAHGVHLSHGSPTIDAGSTEQPHADPLAYHGLKIAVGLAARGLLRIPLAATFPLKDAAAAHALSEERHAPGRIVLVK